MFNRINQLKYFCNKILPLVYDDSLSYYEALCKTTEVVNETSEVVNEHSGRIESIITDLTSLNNDVVNIAHDLGVVDNTVNTHTQRIESITRDLNSLNTNVTTIAHDLGVVDNTVNAHSQRIESITTDLNSLNSNVTTIASDLSTVDATVNKIIPNYWVTTSNEPYIGIPEKTSYIKYIVGFDTAGLYAVTVRTIIENNTKPSMRSFEYYICPGRRPSEQTFDDSKIVRRIVTWAEQRTGNFGDTVTFLFNLSKEVLNASESGRVNLFLDAFSYALQEGDSNIPLNVTTYCSRLLKY